MIGSILNKAISFSAVLVFATFSAGANADEVALKDLLGLYKLTQCDVTSKRLKENQYDCKQDLFFELVQGQFAGVDTDEVAYVLWSGDKPELNYLANKADIQLSESLDKASNILINQDDNGTETLILANGRLIKFQSKYSVNGRDEQVVYTLMPVRRAALPDVILNYPGK
ncbi:hypothetical protein [Neptunomonas phycophila]|nr:hypothetical protein [Neptunomonas phycophila]